MLEELGVPYEVSPVDPAKSEHKTAEYLAIHPHGLIPAAELDGSHLIESAAICMQLADTHPAAGLAPALGTPERARWYQWIVYATATLDEPLVGWILHAMILPEARRQPAKVEHGKAVWSVAAPFLSKSLGDQPWILGRQFTAADVVLGYDIATVARLGGLADYPVLSAYSARLSQRPAFQKTYAR